MTPSESTYNAVQFNGFCVTCYCHESRTITKASFPTIESVVNRGFKDGFPDVQLFVEGLFSDYGDVVGLVTNNDGVVLIDNVVEMDAYYTTMNNWP